MAKFYLVRAFLVASLCFEICVSFVVKPLARQTTTTLFAKKKKGGKKNKEKNKKGGFEWAASFTQQPFEASQKRDLVAAALASFKGRAGKHLFPELETAPDIPKALWKSEALACVLVSAGPEGEGEDDHSVVEYANIAALETVGLKQNEFEQLFSTKPKELQTAAADDNKSVGGAIQLDLPPVMKGEKKFERGYRKKMLRREEPGDVTILDAYRWNIEKSTIMGGKFVTESIGVGYAWGEWLVGENLICSPGGVEKEVAGDLGDLKERISTQGALIRNLKENQGLTNKDPQVVEAVAELMRLKSLDGD